MNFSYWERSTFIKEPDVIIIGSGIAGLFSAYFLKKKSPGLHILVLERGMLPYGASTRNAGFACYGSPSELLKDIETSSEDKVFELVEKRWKGLRKMREILGDNFIDFEPLGGYEVFTEKDNALYEKCVSGLPLFNRYLEEITGINEMYTHCNERIRDFGFERVSQLILNKGEGQVDTGKMMKRLLSLCLETGVEVLNGANVVKIENTNSGVDVFISQPVIPETMNSPEIIKTKKLLICVNGFAKKFLPSEDIEPARAQVLITSSVEGLKLKGSFHYDEGYYYFRNVGNRVLFGGGRNLDFEREKTEHFGLTGIVQSGLEEILKTMIIPRKSYSIEMRWSGIMGLGTHKTPIVKKTEEHIFCAVRMGGMGVAIGSLVGEEASLLVLENN